MPAVHDGFDGWPQCQSHIARQSGSCALSLGCHGRPWLFQLGPLSGSDMRLNRNLIMWRGCSRVLLVEVCSIS